MIPSSFRLVLRQEQDFFNEAKKNASRYLVVYQRHQTETPKLAIIVPLKKVKKTVTRNLIKRQLASLVMTSKDRLPARELVFYYKGPADLTTYQELEHDFQKLVSGLSHA